jgi:hypothetical protein
MEEGYQYRLFLDCRNVSQIRKIGEVPAGFKRNLGKSRSPE